MKHDAGILSFMRVLLALCLLVSIGAVCEAAEAVCRPCRKVCSSRNKAKYPEVCANCLKECEASAPQAGSTAAAETGTALPLAVPAVASAPAPTGPKRRSRKRGAAASPAVAAPAADPPPKSCGRTRDTGEEDFSCLDEENLARRLQFEKAVQAKIVADPVCDPIGDRFDSRRCELASDKHASAIARIEKIAEERSASKPNPCQNPEMGDEEYCRLSCGECGLTSDGRYLPMGKFTTKARDELRKKGKVLKPAAGTPEAKAEPSVPVRQEDCLSQNQEVCERSCDRFPETGRPPNQMTCKSSCRRKAASFCKQAPAAFSD
ncbi:MAG: hypothetical protein A2X36_16625 [Elusimicrobia bacterium GWA2_69_24]|nr:MAG: hypothetical protein A2X36_16625 [Elusimicrobia bacterium GWA2_69_24]HBL16658.1 hypothetical protein [Elusimicrobiota bacterium]